jgi:energy-coupling factor transporter ATP-binding protein EcfA2
LKLTRVTLRNVRNLPDGDIAFAHPDGRPFEVALVTGPSAAGKTTLVEAIAMAKERVAGNGRAARPRAFLRHGASNGLVELTLLLDVSERQRAGVVEPVVRLTVQLSGALDDHDARVVALLRSSSMDYFPARRRLASSFEPVTAFEWTTDEGVEARMRLSNDPDKYRGLVPWIRDALLGAATQLASRIRDTGLVLGSELPDALAPFRQMLASLCPWLRLGGLARDGATPMFARNDGSTPALPDLSDAELDAVLISASWQRARPEHGIVLIDRLDLHAHPSDQLRWLQTLTSAGDNQLVVATSSEALLRGVPAAQHVEM